MAAGDASEFGEGPIPGRIAGQSTQDSRQRLTFLLLETVQRPNQLGNNRAAFQAIGGSACNSERHLKGEAASVRSKALSSCRKVSEDLTSVQVQANGLRRHEFGSAHFSGPVMDGIARLDPAAKVNASFGKAAGEEDAQIGAWLRADDPAAVMMDAHDRARRHRALEQLRKGSA